MRSLVRRPAIGAPRFTRSFRTRQRREKRPVGNAGGLSIQATARRGQHSKQELMRFAGWTGRIQLVNTLNARYAETPQFGASTIWLILRSPPGCRARTRPPDSVFFS